MKKAIGIIFAIILMFSIVLAVEKIPVKYIKTSDGDTARFDINGENVRVRFLGINTPEVAGEDKVEEPYGNEAMEYTKNKLENAKKIEIEYDENADKEDRFGRPLVYVWIDDNLFQEELVRLGYAKTYMMKANYKYADELKSAEREAKSEKLGVWNDEVGKYNNQSENSGEDTNNYDEEVIRVHEDSINPLYIIIGFIIIVGLICILKKQK